MTNSLTGHFLIASPHLADTNFYRSVVLILQHDSEGALGVVLNRPTDKTIAQMWELLDEGPCDNQQPIYIGGPVAGPLLAVHTDVDYGENEVIDDVCFSSSKPIVTQIIQDSVRPCRLLLGYAGWGSQQLDDELEAGGWLVLPATRDLVFSEADDLWHRVADKVGMDILTSTITPKVIPDDPSMN